MVEVMLSLLVFVVVFMAITGAVVWGFKELSAQGRKGEAVQQAQQEVESELAAPSFPGASYELTLRFGDREVRVPGRLKSVEAEYRGADGSERPVVATVFVPD